MNTSCYKAFILLFLFYIAFIILRESIFSILIYPISVPLLRKTPHKALTMPTLVALPTGKSSLLHNEEEEVDYDDDDFSPVVKANNNCLDYSSAKDDDFMFDADLEEFSLIEYSNTNNVPKKSGRQL